MQRGSTMLRHRVVTLTAAADPALLLEANPRRVRCLMFNATAVGTGSTAYAGADKDHDGDALAAANGWPLNEEQVAAGEGWKLPANVLELFTQDKVYGVAAGADATVKVIEELL